MENKHVASLWPWELTPLGLREQCLQKSGQRPITLRATRLSDGHMVYVFVLPSEGEIGFAEKWHSAIRWVERRCDLLDETIEEYIRAEFPW